jgi:hypothetical protein
MSYNHICSSVADFNYLFGVISHQYPNNQEVISDRFDSFSPSFDSSQVNLRFGLINEEIKELEQAVKDKNPIEIIDALCDILYVVAGAKVYYNLPINKKIMYDSNYNTTENVDTVDLQLTNTDIEFMNSILDTNYGINSILNEILDHNQILNNLTELFLNKQKIIYHELFIKHLIKFYDVTLDKIVVNIFRMGQLFNLRIIQLFDIVHNSNMTKICENEQDALDTVCWYKIHELRYKEPAYRIIHYNDKDYFVIYDVETKKILKSIKYIPAKFI